MLFIRGYLYLLIFLFSMEQEKLFSMAASAEQGNSTLVQTELGIQDNEMIRNVDLVNKGWDRLYKWDFYNDPLDWDISSATRKASGGYIRIENGTLEFGYSTLGSIIFYKTDFQILPNVPFLIVARVKTNNPYRSMLGFYSSPDKMLHNFVYIKNTDWKVISMLYEFIPFSKQKLPRNLYPAVQVLTKQDNVYVDWIELWVLKS